MDILWSKVVWFRANKKLLGKISLLLVILLTVGLISLGCIGGMLPIGWSGGAVAGNTLFVGSTEGRLVAVNTIDGSRQWSEAIRAQTQGGLLGCAPQPGAGCAAASAGVAIYGTPAISEDLVYIGGYNGKIYAFNSNSLEVRWVYPREEYLEPIVGGLLVAQGKVYFGGSEGKVYAMDAATGDRQWEFETGDKIWATPAIDGDTLFIGSFDKKLYALDTASGSPKWVFATEGEGAIAATPLVYNSTVYIGSFDRYLYAVDEISGSLKWKFMGENWFWAKPAVSNDTIYAANLDGKVYALQANNGAKVAEFDLQSPISSTPVVVDSSIIFATREGAIYSLDINSHELKPVADIGKGILGPLSASEGIVYLHTQDMTLHRINVYTGAILPSISLKSTEESPSSGTTNWGFLIAIVVIGIILVIVMQMLGRRRKA